jgi:uncharacterized protein (DUF1330 family)
MKDFTNLNYLAPKMKMRDKRGQLTAYAFACGYIERIGQLNLSRGHNAYYVKGGIDNTHIYKVFTTLKDARKCMRSYL